MKKMIFISLLSLVSLAGLFAQELSAEDTAKANNPLADMTAFSAQTYYMPDTDMSASFLRVAKPLADGKVLVRASLPILASNTAEGFTTGLGDINVFASYSFISQPGLTAGIGPMVSMPTTTGDFEHMTGGWQVGAAMVVFYAPSPIYQMGGLITYSKTVSDNADGTDKNTLAIQPFLFLQMGGGAYLRSAGISTFEFEDGFDYSIPLGIGIGKAMKAGDVVFNVFAEPTFTVASNSNQNGFQFYTGINLQFN